MRKKTHQNAPARTIGSGDSGHRVETLEAYEIARDRGVLGESGAGQYLLQLAERRVQDVGTPYALHPAIRHLDREQRNQHKHIRSRLNALVGKINQAGVPHDDLVYEWADAWSDYAFYIGGRPWHVHTELKLSRAEYFNAISNLRDAGWKFSEPLLRTDKHYGGTIRGLY